MVLITSIVLIVLGVLAASSSIIAKRPDAKSYIDAVVPYQGWLGIVACVWGIWIVLNAIVHLEWIRYIPIWWLTVLLSGALQFCLGVLLGYELLTKYLLGRNEEATKRGEQLRQRLVPYQVTLGYAAIILGVWFVAVTLIFNVV